MLRPELRRISPNDYDGWEAFEAAELTDPWNAFGWFVLDIGLAGEKGTTLFQILVSTRAAVSRALGDDKARRFLIVDSFEPHLLEKALKDHVSSQEGHTWDEIVGRLRRNMYWEYEKQWS